MKTRTKVLGLVLAAVLLVTAGVFGTLAYLTDTTAPVVNTFTVGDVQIKLDETDVSPNSNGGRVTANSYKLIPGAEYVKDPMVTVLAGSEAAYIRMKVTVNCAAELDDIFDPDGANLTSIFQGYDSSAWPLVGTVRDAQANTITYVFRAGSPTQATDTDLALAPLFEKLVVPGFITGGQLAELEDLTITVIAEAIQAEGFATADAAWAAFDA